MRKNKWTDLSMMSEEEKDSHVKAQRREAMKRYRNKLKNIPVIKSPEEIHSDVIQYQKEQKRKSQVKYKKKRLHYNLELAKQALLEYNPNLNLLYLNRYIKILSVDYSSQNGLEKHHILPKSIFPEYRNDQTNLKQLSPKAHFIAHKILHLMMPENVKMAKALFLMSNFSSANNVNSRIYEKIRKLHVVGSKEIYEKQKISGTTPSSYVRPWNSHIAKERTKTFWYYIETVFSILEEFPDKGDRRIQGVLLDLFNLQSTQDLVKTARRYLMTGWTTDDELWKILRKNHIPKNQITERALIFRDRDAESRKANGIKNRGRRGPRKIKAIKPGMFFCAVKPWNHHLANEKSILTWKLADKIFKDIGRYRSAVAHWHALEKEIGCNLAEGPFKTIYSKQKMGWDPSSDLDWLVFAK